jgi:integrase
VSPARPQRTHLHQRLTEKFVQEIPVPVRGRVEIGDVLCPGLWLRISGDNSKTFAIRYRLGGKALRYTLGKHPAITLKEARATAFDLLKSVRDGKDPRHRKWDAATVDQWLTVEYLCDNYFEKLARDVKTGRLKQSHADEVRRRFKADFIKTFAKRPIATLFHREIEKFLQHVEDRAPRVAAHLYYDLKGFYNWVVREGHIEKSPMMLLVAPTKVKAREKVLSIDELKRIWRATENHHNCFNVIVRLLILTAQRRGEVAGSELSEFDSVTKLWTIPARRTKSSRMHRVPMSDLALSILDKWVTYKKPIGPTLFPSFGYNRTTFSGFSKCKRRLDLASNVFGWTLHDLRRTTSTCLAEMSVAPHVIERILNHASGTMTPIARVYNRATYEAEMRQALDKWSELFLDLP